MIRTIATLVTAPTNEPVTLDEVKAWLRITTPDENVLLTDLIGVARDAAEKYMSRALLTQTWKLTVDLPKDRSMDSLPAGVYDLPVSVLYGDLPKEFALPYQPLQSITSVETYDTSNTPSTYSSSNYFADTASSRLVLNDTAVWPSPLRDKVALVITYVVGYVTAANVPKNIKTGMKMHIQKMYDERIDCEMPTTCMGLYDQYKVYNG